MTENMQMTDKGAQGFGSFYEQPDGNEKTNDQHLAEGDQPSLPQTEEVAGLTPGEHK